MQEMSQLVNNEPYHSAVENYKAITCFDVVQQFCVHQTAGGSP